MCLCVTGSMAGARRTLADVRLPGARVTVPAHRPIDFVLAVVSSIPDLDDGECSEEPRDRASCLSSRCGPRPTKFSTVTLSLKIQVVNFQRGLHEACRPGRAQRRRDDVHRDPGPLRADAARRGGAGLRAQRAHRAGSSATAAAPGISTLPRVVSFFMRKKLLFLVFCCFGGE